MSLPSDMELDIFLRLPIKMIMRCKCVCKSWLDVLTSADFVKSHLSKSVPGLIVYDWERDSNPYKIAKFVDYIDPNCHEHPLNTIFNVNMSIHSPLNMPIRSSCNGLLLHKEFDRLACDLCVCNPVTREYIMLDSQTDRSPSSPDIWYVQESFGFGMSRSRGEYKVVRISCLEQMYVEEVNQFECQVYTIGTGSWRKIAFSGGVEYVDDPGLFLNGNLHFLVFDSSSPYYQIYCLDLETEVFSIFSSPANEMNGNLLVWRDCLCVCHHLTSSNVVDIWMMKEYGDEKSWTKEFVIRDMIIDYFRYVRVVFEDGSDNFTILVDYRQLFYYSSTTETMLEVDLSGPNCDSFDFSSTTIYAPSFVSLKTLTMENVTSF